MMTTWAFFIFTEKEITGLLLVAAWEIDKNKDGIVVYTKVEKDSYFKSFKAVMLVDASTTEIIRLLKNADNYTKWYL